MKIVVIPFIKVYRWNSRRLWRLCRWSSRKLWIYHVFNICWVTWWCLVVFGWELNILYLIFVGMLSCILVGIKCLLRGSCNNLDGKFLFKQCIWALLSKRCKNLESSHSENIVRILSIIKVCFVKHFFYLLLVSILLHSWLWVGKGGVALHQVVSE